MDTTQKAKILGLMPGLAGLEEQELYTLAPLAEEEACEAGQVIYQQGAYIDKLHIVAQGKIKIYRSSSSGSEFVIALLGPGEVLGEVATMTGSPLPCSAQAVEESLVLKIKWSDFLAFATTHPNAALGVITLLCERLLESQSRLGEMATYRAEARIAQTLLRLYRHHGDTLSFTRQQIAEMSGTTTETAIRVMSRMKEGGIIESVRGAVTILQPQKLELLGEGPP